MRFNFLSKIFNRGQWVETFKIIGLIFIGFFLNTGVIFLFWKILELKDDLSRSRMIFGEGLFLNIDLVFLWTVFFWLVVFMVLSYRALLGYSVYLSANKKEIFNKGALFPIPNIYHIAVLLILKCFHLIVITYCILELPETLLALADIWSNGSLDFFLKFNLDLNGVVFIVFLLIYDTYITLLVYFDVFKKISILVLNKFRGKKV